MRDINTWKRYSDVYVTLYKYRECDRTKRFRPKYETAVVDKILFDFDVYGRVNGKEAYDIYTHLSASDLEKWARQNNYKRKWFFTGGGFHAIIYGIGRYDTLFRATQAIVDKLDLKNDTSTIGDFAQIRRVPNTLNRSGEKKERNLYCIPITPEELSLNFECIKELAKEPRFGFENTIGKQLFNMNEYKSYVSPYRKEFVDKPIEDILGKETVENMLKRCGIVKEDFCPAIKSILSDGVVLHKQRLMLIKYLKNIMGLEYEECVLMLSSTLRRQEFDHCLEELQPQLVFSRDRKFHPERWKVEGRCPEDCSRCEDVMKVRRGLELS